MKTRLFLLLIAMTAIAVPSFGQYYMEEIITGEGGGGSWSDSGSYASGVQLDNPCTAWADWTWVDYNVYLDQEGSQTSLGERVLFNESTTMGGSAYAASGASTSDVTYRSQPYTIRKYHKVNTYDQFHVVTVLDFNPATRYTTVSLETACGDGTPDSAQ